MTRVWSGANLRVTLWAIIVDMIAVWLDIPIALNRAFMAAIETVEHHLPE